jgi:hypothetical protein
MLSSASNYNYAHGTDFVSWEANSSSPSQEIPQILCIRTSVVYSKQPATFLYPQRGEWNVLHFILALKIHFNIILPTMGWNPGRGKMFISFFQDVQNGSGTQIASYSIAGIGGIFLMRSFMFCTRHQILLGWLLDPEVGEDVHIWFWWEHLKERMILKWILKEENGVWSGFM